MNVDKMRRYAERNAEARDARERRSWLDSLTPEHRAKHRALNVCDECVSAGFRRAMDPLVVAMNRWTASRREPPHQAGQQGSASR